MTDTTNDEKTDDVTTLAKVNDSPQEPDETQAATSEHEDTTTVLAKVNDNPPGEQSDDASAVLKDAGQATSEQTPELADEKVEPERPAMIR